MTSTRAPETVEDRARRQAEANIETIRDMMERYDAAQAADDTETIEAIQQQGDEYPLWAGVRSGWVGVGDLGEMEPAEYRLELCTGGPATRIVGDLNRWGEPASARLEYQDWFTPWEVAATERDEPALLWFATLFPWQV